MEYLKLPYDTLSPSDTPVSHSTFSKKIGITITTVAARTRHPPRSRRNQQHGGYGVTVNTEVCGAFDSGSIPDSRPF